MHFCIVLILSLILVGAEISATLNAPPMSLQFHRNSSTQFQVGEFGVLILTIQLPVEVELTSVIEWYHTSIPGPSTSVPATRTNVGENTHVYPRFTRYRIDQTKNVVATTNQKRLMIHTFRFHFEPFLWSDRGTWSCVYDGEVKEVNLTLVVMSKLQPLQVDILSQTPSVQAAMSNPRVIFPDAPPSAYVPVQLDNPDSVVSRPDPNSEYGTSEPGSKWRPYDLRVTDMKRQNATLRVVCSTSCAYPVQRLIWTLRNTTHHMEIQTRNLASVDVSTSLEAGAYGYTESCAESSPDMSRRVSILLIHCHHLKLFGLFRLECSMTNEPDPVERMEHQVQGGDSPWRWIRHSALDIRRLTNNPIVLNPAQSSSIEVRTVTESVTLFCLCPAPPNRMSHMLLWESGALILLLLFYILIFVIAFRKCRAYKHNQVPHSATVSTLPRTELPVLSPSIHYSKLLGKDVSNYVVSFPPPPPHQVAVMSGDNLAPGSSEQDAESFL